LGYTFRPSETPLIDFGAKVYYSTTQNRQTFLAPDADGVYSALGVNVGAPVTDQIGTYGFDLHNTSRFVTGALNHALTIGGDGVIDKVHTDDQAGGYVSVLTPSGQRTLTGEFVQDEISYGGWLRALGAVRFDQYSLNGGGVSSSGGHLSPKLTLGVTPIQGFEIYGTYAEGYRAPSVTETLISGVHPFPAFTFLPNPNLAPEVAHNLEAGVNLKYNDVFRTGDTFRGKLTAFTNQVDNYIDVEQVGAPILTSFVPGFPNSACATAPPGFCIPFQPFQYVNVAKARLDGVEAEGAYDWGLGVASLAASAVNGKNLVDGLSLTTVAPYRASATLAFRFFDDRSLTIGARFTAVSASASNVPTSATLPPSKGYGLVDLFGSYVYNDRVSGDFSVTNLFNKSYTPFLQSEPSPGLTAKLGLTIRLAAK
jgi:hemoglobin/transferrin/lactoferrin receptor protein